MNSRPEMVSNHKSPTSGPEGGTADTVMVGVRCASCGVGPRVGGGGITTCVAGTTAAAEGCVWTHCDPDGPTYQTYSRPVVVLNHRSPSAGAGGGVGALMTVGNCPSHA